MKDSFLKISKLHFSIYKRLYFYFIFCSKTPKNVVLRSEKIFAVELRSTAQNALITLQTIEINIFRHRRELAFVLLAPLLSIYQPIEQLKVLKQCSRSVRYFFSKYLFQRSSNLKKFELSSQIFTS